MHVIVISLRRKNKSSLKCDIKMCVLFSYKVKGLIMVEVDFDDIDRDDFDYSPLKLYRGEQEDIVYDNDVFIDNSLFVNGNPCAMFAWWAITRLFILTTERLWCEISSLWPY